MVLLNHFLILRKVLQVFKPFLNIYSFIESNCVNIFLIDMNKY